MKRLFAHTQNDRTWGMIFEVPDKCKIESDQSILDTLEQIRANNTTHEFTGPWFQCAICNYLYEEWSPKGRNAPIQSSNGRTLCRECAPVILDGVIKARDAKLEAKKARERELSDKALSDDPDNYKAALELLNETSSRNRQKATR